MSFYAYSPKRGTYLKEDVSGRYVEVRNLALASRWGSYKDAYQVCGKRVPKKFRKLFIVGEEKDPEPLWVSKKKGDTQENESPNLVKKDNDLQEEKNNTAAKQEKAVGQEKPDDTASATANTSLNESSSGTSGAVLESTKKMEQESKGNAMFAVRPDFRQVPVNLDAETDASIAKIILDIPVENSAEEVSNINEPDTNEQDATPEAESQEITTPQVTEEKPETNADITPDNADLAEILSTMATPKSEKAIELAANYNDAMAALTSAVADVLRAGAALSKIESEIPEIEKTVSGDMAKLSTFIGTHSSISARDSALIYNALHQQFNVKAKLSKVKETLTRSKEALDRVRKFAQTN